MKLKPGDKTRIYSRLAKLYTPPQRLSAWEWADKYRILPATNAEGGRWSTDRVPWVRDVVEAIDDPRYDTVVVWAASQVSKTDGIILNYIGKRAMLDPVPMIYFGPDQANVKDISQDRLLPMLQDTPELWDALAKGQANQTFKKTINGAKLYMGWASSASQLASKPAGMIFVDERSRMSVVGREGDPVTIGQGRGGTYPGFTVVVVSTVTEGLAIERFNPDTRLSYWDFPDEVPDPTASLYREGTCMEWVLPCGHCGEYFGPRLSTLFIPEDKSPAVAARGARLVCPHCGGLIDEAMKAQGNARGRYVNGRYQSVTSDGDVIGDVPENSTASFWIPGLASMFPGGLIRKRAEKLIKAQLSKDDDKIRAVHNVEFGELWTPAGEAADHEIVQKLRQPYKMGHIPEQAAFIGIGADWHKDRIYYVVRAWGEGREMSSWLIEHGELWGDTRREPGRESAAWQQLQSLIMQDWGGLRVGACAIDSGYNPHDVYDFCRMDERGVSFPVKGRGKMDRAFYPARIEYTRSGKSLAGVQLWHVNTDMLKRRVFSLYQRPAGVPGSFNLPEDCGEDYLAQLTSETRTVDKGGRVYWVASGDNHYFDCEVYALMGAMREGAQDMRPPKRRAQAPPKRQQGGDWVRTEGTWI